MCLYSHESVSRAFTYTSLCHVPLLTRVRVTQPEPLRAASQQASNFPAGYTSLDASRAASVTHHNVAPKKPAPPPLLAPESFPSKKATTNTSSALPQLTQEFFPQRQAPSRPPLQPSGPIGPRLISASQPAPSESFIPRDAFVSKPPDPEFDGAKSGMRDTSAWSSYRTLGPSTPQAGMTTPTVDDAWKFDQSKKLPRQPGSYAKPLATANANAQLAALPKLTWTSHAAQPEGTQQRAPRPVMAADLLGPRTLNTRANQAKPKSSADELLGAPGIGRV
jgi:hypothetical protein